MTAAQFGVILLNVGQGALFFVAAGAAVGAIVYAVMAGLRAGINALHYVLSDRGSLYLHMRESGFGHAEAKERMKDFDL